MVRISDLVKGEKPAPQKADEPPKAKESEDGIRLSRLSGLLNIPRPAPAAPAEAPPTTQEGEKAVLPTPPQGPAAGPPVEPNRRPEPPPPPKEIEPSRTQQTVPSSLDGRATYLSAQAYLREVKGLIVAGQKISLEKPLAMIGPMIDAPSLVDAMYLLTLAYDETSDLTVASPVNSMIYSYKIGRRMGYSVEQLTEVCLAALHHDVGMYALPEQITKKEGRLSEAEFALIRKHTQIGRDLFVSLGYPAVARAIYEHHERENGQGYPQGLKGDEISEYAKIIGICDSYEAMTHDRPHKKAVAQHLSVLQLAGCKDQLFSPAIVKIFLDVITLYPIGSYVRLNNKAIGQVVETNPSNPLKPTVRIVIDGHGKRTADEKLINLAENAILTIVGGVAAEELPA